MQILKQHTIRTKLLWCLVFVVVFALVSLTAHAQVKINATGTGNVFNVQYPANLPTLPNGMMVTFFSNQSITGPAQLNLNSLGNAPILKFVTNPLQAGDIVNGQAVTVIFDGTSWQLLSPLPNSSGTSPFVQNGSTITTSVSGSRLGLGVSTVNGSAIFEMNSTTSGVVFPRMTAAQRNAIASPTIGMFVFNTSNACLSYYTGTQWVDLCGNFTPLITGFSPSSGQVGTAITITGYNFLGTSSILIGGVSASYLNLTSTSVIAIAPNVSGIITINGSNGTGSSSNSFTLVQTTVNYSFTGALQSLTIPSGVTSINVKLWGAPGGSAGNGMLGAYGAYASGTIPVFPGNVIDVIVGGMGASGALISGAAGGGGGGGFSGIMIGGSFLAVAAGGGGGGGFTTGGTAAWAGDSGNGAINNGSAVSTASNSCDPTYYGSLNGGNGGNTAAFGIGGAGTFCSSPGGSGGYGGGGSGGAGDSSGSSTGSGGGGGGGGYLGGRGGGAHFGNPGGGASGGGGWGGSSFVTPSGNNVVLIPGGGLGLGNNGKVTIIY